MKTTSLLTLTFAGLLALVTALPHQEAAANDPYAEAWGYYGDKSVITGPTNVDEFGMPIAKRTGVPNAGANNGNFNGGNSGNNNDAWNAWGENKNGGNGNGEHGGGMGARMTGTGAPNWFSVGGIRPEATGMPQGGPAAPSQSHHPNGNH